jgi:hypothetical protein
MNIEDIVPSYLTTHLTSSFKEREPLDITHCATNLYNHYGSPG